MFSSPHHHQPHPLSTHHRPPLAHYFHVYCPVQLVSSNHSEALAWLGNNCGSNLVSTFATASTVTGKSVQDLVMKCLLHQNLLTEGLDHQVQGTDQDSLFVCLQTHPLVGYSRFGWILSRGLCLVAPLRGADPDPHTINSIYTFRVSLPAEVQLHPVYSKS